MFYLTLPGTNIGIEDPLKNDKGKINSGMSLADVVASLIPYIMAFAGIILFLMLIFGGFTMLSSAGNPEGVKKGQQMIVNALIGFLIIFIAYWIMQMLQIMLGLSLGFGNTP